MIQGNLSPTQWEALKGSLGIAWRYTNVAVNPFTSKEVLAIASDQITVAQLPVGLPEGIHSDGTVVLPAGMKISGAPDRGNYNLFLFMEQLKELKTAPTLILLGPSAPEWPDQVNVERIRALLPVLRNGVEILWDHLPRERREFVWRLGA